jgi:hypothetical protein
MLVFQANVQQILEIDGLISHIVNMYCNNEESPNEWKNKKMDRKPCHSVLPLLRCKKVMFSQKFSVNNFQINCYKLLNLQLLHALAKTSVSNAMPTITGFRQKEALDTDVFSWHRSRIYNLCLTLAVDNINFYK